MEPRASRLTAQHVNHNTSLNGAIHLHLLKPRALKRLNSLKYRCMATGYSRLHGTKHDYVKFY